MANASRIYGLRPVKTLSGAPLMGNLETFNLPASDGTATFVGDLVKSGGSADATGVQTIARSSADADLHLGVVVGFIPDYTNLNIPGQYRAASTNRYALVHVAPFTVFEIQADAATAVTDIGLNVGLNYTAGSTTTGQSQLTAKMSTKATTSTLPLKIVGVVQRPDQDMSDSSNWKLLVTLNTNNFVGAGTAGT